MRKESSNPNGVQLLIPQASLDGSDTTFLWFLQGADRAQQDNLPAVEDLFLRKAAQRGSWFAMDQLASWRYELGHFEECMRWNSRLLTFLAENKNQIGEQIPPISDSEFNTLQEDAKANIEWLKSQGVSVGRNTPNDLSPSRFIQEHTYCLKCGKLKFSNAPIDSCNNDVHIVMHNFGI